MLNLLLVERLLVRVVATISLSQVCWQVFSPGAEINQNSVMAAGRNFVPRAADVRKLLKVKKQDLIFSCYVFDLVNGQHYLKCYSKILI